MTRANPGKTLKAVQLTQHAAAAGCAAKLGIADLAQVLHQLPRFKSVDLLVGTETSDDAGVFRLRDDLAIVNTVDFFTPIVDDPFVFGQIAAANALSDIYAMGAEPRTAMNIVGFSKARHDLSVLVAILSGGAERVRAAGAVVVGGHSLIDEEVKYGLAITGVIHPRRIIRNTGVRIGDSLVLTKPLGTGIVTTALKQRKVKRAVLQATIASMLVLNRKASMVMRRFQVHACSDITGFGLMGHAMEMASSSGVTIELRAAALPILPGAVALAEAGCLTGGCGRNRSYLNDKMATGTLVQPAIVEIALDPQTSGGLLISVAGQSAPRLVAALHSAGDRSAAIVGQALPKGDVPVTLR